ncbi:MAG: hypothetical protein ABSG27_17285, partial [Candidatus Acidiferrales bacterium]
PIKVLQTFALPLGDRADHCRRENHSTRGCGQERKKSLDGAKIPPMALGHAVCTPRSFPIK